MAYDYFPEKGAMPASLETLNTTEAVINAELPVFPMGWAPADDYRVRVRAPGNPQSQAAIKAEGTTSFETNMPVVSGKDIVAVQKMPLRIRGLLRREGRFSAMFTRSGGIMPKFDSDGMPILNDSYVEKMNAAERNGAAREPRLVHMDGYTLASFGNPRQWRGPNVGGDGRDGLGVIAPGTHDFTGMVELLQAASPAWGRRALGESAVRAALDGTIEVPTEELFSSQNIIPSAPNDGVISGIIDWPV